MIAYIPDVEQADRWLKKWHRGSRVAGKEDAAITSRWHPKRRARRALDLRAMAMQRIQSQHSIFPKLNIETAYRRIAGNIGTRTRLDSSEPLTGKARAKAELECGIDLVSAFDDEQWDRLYDGWELEEQRYREEQKLLWQAALADVMARHPLDGSVRSKEAQDYEVEELRKAWSASARVRPWSMWSRP